MATLLLDAPPKDRLPAPVGMATLVLVQSPIRSPEGQLRVRRVEVQAGQRISEVLPPRQNWAHLVWNGGVVTQTAEQVILQPGDEVWAWPQWGLIGGTLGALISAAVIGTALSIATSYLSYLLFPPQKAQIDRPEEHTFSFGGIQTATGPGNVIPVIYGRHRVGGQLLMAAVDQHLNVLGTPGQTTQVQAVTTPPTLRMLLALGEGPIDAILVDTIEINGQPIANFIQAPHSIGLQVRNGTPDQTPIAGFDETRNTLAVPNGEIPDDSGNLGFALQYSTSQAVEAFILNIVFQQGLFNVNGKGDKEDNVVNLSYAVRATGTGPFDAPRTLQIAAQRTAPVRVGIRHEGLALGLYDVRINFGGVRHTNDLRAKWTPTLESVTEIQHGSHSYPHTALLAIEAVPSESLQGSLPNITVEVQGRTVAVGVEATPRWSDNPAWCVRDFLTNSRYGLGIPESDLDLVAFSQWAAYCDEIMPATATSPAESRHTFNYVLDRDMRAQALLMEMMGGSRTILLKSQGLWVPRPTRNDPPVQLLSWTTCTNLQITYTHDPDRINVMEGRFANETDGYGQDVLTWPIAEHWPPEIRKASLELRGITKPSRVMRALQFELNRRTFENIRLEMDCALDAIVLQVHDIFRFSHPLPGWGTSGRIGEGSTQDTLYLDEAVTMVGGQSYHVYIKHTTDYTEVRPVINTALTTHTLHLAVPLAFAPAPRDSVWAFGTSGIDTAVRLFRVTKLTRSSDLTVHLEAVVHNPSITEEPDAVPIGLPPGLPNPLGPPPPLTSLVALELTRVQANGASLKVANLSWDVAPLGPGYAPYAGVDILRRTILESSQAGMSALGTADHGALQSANDGAGNFMPLMPLRGHVLEWDDSTVVTGGTYQWLVVPVSQRGVPNNAGALTVKLHIAGPTTPDFFPSTPLNLRLRGKPVPRPGHPEDLEWEGRDIHVQWDAAQSELFSETFFVQDYIVQIWAPGQEYLLRAAVTGTADLQFHYTYEQNVEDQTRNGYPTARRAVDCWVWARTNTQRLSLDPAHILVTNPAPDMSMIRPAATGFGTSLLIDWTQYVEPRDFHHYDVHLDTVTPPLAIYQGIGASMRKVIAGNLLVGATYYTFVMPYDSFGQGLPSQVSAATVPGTDPAQVDTTPPEPPTGLALTTGSRTAPDGTIVPWVEASWTASPSSDIGSYKVLVRVGPVPTSGPDVAPTPYDAEATATRLRFDVPGGTLIRVRLVALDHFSNYSTYEPPTGDVSLTAGGDTVPPGPAHGLIAISDTKTMHLQWTPPADRDYAYSLVYAAPVQDRNAAAAIGTGLHTFTPSTNHAGAPLGPTERQFYWVQTVDTSGNRGPFFPDSAVAGIDSSTALLVDAYIGSLGADKITAGTIDVLVALGVAQRLFLDGRNYQILIYDNQPSPVLRVLLGKIGGANDDWGLNLYNAAGVPMLQASTGVEAAGIADAAITAPTIWAGAVTAQALTTATAVITTGAQIANAIINYAHITSLAADTIVSSSIRVPLYVGGVETAARIVLDGPNQAFYVYDINSTARVWIGKVGAGVADYGMLLWNSLGQEMLNFNTGMSEFGIQALAITSAHIRDAAITNAKIANLEVDSAKIANLTVGTGKIAANAVSASLLFAGAGGGGVPSVPGIVYATITFPSLAAGDQVWLMGTCTAVDAGAGGLGMNMTLREDSITGTPHQQCVAAETNMTGMSNRFPMVVQSVYVAPTTLVNKAFVLAFIGASSVQDVRLAGLQLKK